MKKAILIAIILLSLTMLFGKSYYAKDYYCRIDVKDNGDFQVRETFQYHFQGGPFQWVEREIPDRYTDGIEFIRGFVKTVDGEIINETNDFHYKHGDLIVRWNFEPVSDAVLNFEVEFYARRVCYLEADMQYIRWQAIPEEHEFQISKGSIEMILPRAVEPIIFLDSGVTRLDSGYQENQIWWNLDMLRQNQSFVSGIAIAAGTFPIEQPQWQLNRELATKYFRYYKLLGILTCLLLIALIVAVIIDAVKLNKMHASEVLPDDMLQMHPALVTKLINGFDGSLVPFAAVFFRLIKCGAVKLVKINKHKYQYEPTDIIPEDEFDRRFQEILQEQYAKGKKDVKKLFMSFDKYKGKYSKLLNDWHYENGFASELEHKRQKRMLIPFMSSLFLMIIVMIASIMLIESGILWVMFLTFALSYATIYFGYKLSRIYVYTDLGFQRKYAWKLWKKDMQKLIKHKDPELKEMDFDETFPFALVLGFAEPFVKYYKKAGYDITESEVLNTFEDYESFNGFIAWYLVVANSTGATGGASGGGTSAGGGSASAG